MPEYQKPKTASPQQAFNDVCCLAGKTTPFFSEIWRRQEQMFGEAWVSEIVENILVLFGEDHDAWQNALSGYAEFAMDALRNQKYFEENGRYQWNTSKEIQQKYYESEEHMMNAYLPGMYLSHYLWPHHFRLLSFFRSEVLSKMQSPSVFYDVGIGTGLYSREVLRHFSQARGRGIDISRYSIAFTKKMLEAFGLMDRYQFEFSNIFEVKVVEEAADFVVSQEVLEHLENPLSFCRILRRMTKKGGCAYITAAINAAHSDHIYLFKSPEEVNELLVSAGWQVDLSKSEFAYSGKQARVTPCVAGFLCTRKD